MRAWVPRWEERALSNEVFDLVSAEAPLLISMPHVGTGLPAEYAARMTAAALDLPDTDWHVDRLYAFARDLGVSMIAAKLSRYVIDLNRDPQGAALYPGADNTELCPTTTFADEAIYRPGQVPDAAEVEKRRQRYFAPYHAAIERELQRIEARHGCALLLDAHSIRAVVPRFFSGRLPDLNLGTAGGRTAAPELEALAFEVLAREKGFSSVLNGRFQGGFITRHFGQPQAHRHALQLEIVQDCYMNEAAPLEWSARRAGALIGLLERFIAALLTFRPRV